MSLITESLFTTFWNDDTGFIVSAELVLIATLAVLGMIVGLSQVQHAVTSELNDVAHAVGSLNQSYFYSGFHARKWMGWTKSRTFGSFFFDGMDACDGWGCAIACDAPIAECGGGFGGVGFGGGGFGGGFGGGIGEVTTPRPLTTIEPACSPVATCAPAPTCSQEITNSQPIINVPTPFTPVAPAIAPAPAGK